MATKVKRSDIAKSLGVSPATVSVVLNGSQTVSISPQLKRKVIAKAHEMGYDFSSGRSRKTDRREIVFLVAHPGGPMIAYYQMLTEVQTIAKRRGYKVTFVSARNNAVIVFFIVLLLSCFCSMFFPRTSIREFSLPC